MMPASITDPDCFIRLIRQWLMWNGGVQDIGMVAAALGTGYVIIKRAIWRDRGEHLEVVGHSVKLKDGKK
jgi:hypothetical protein